MKKYLTFIIFITLTGFRSVPADKYNYLSIPETQHIGNLGYRLSWSAHPNSNYYKQEYLPDGETEEHFTHMVTIDFLITDADAKDMLTLKEQELQKRKQTDAVVNFQQFENPDKTEYILDFILSDSKGDKLNIVEWNAYRYKNYTDKAGHKGILMVAITERAYTDQITSFLKGLKDSKPEKVSSLISYKMPEITIK